MILTSVRKTCRGLIKMNRARRANKFPINQTDLEPVLSWKWFSIPVPVFCDCSLPSKEEIINMSGNLLRATGCFFVCLFFSASPHLKQPLKVCFLPCNVGSEACTTSCRHTCGHDTTMIILKVHDHLYLCLFNKEYICYMISLKYTAGFLCIYTGVRTLFGDQQLLT